MITTASTQDLLVISGAKVGQIVANPLAPTVTEEVLSHRLWMDTYAVGNVTEVE